MKRQSTVVHLWSYALVATLLTVITVFTSFPGSAFAQASASPQITSTVLDNYPPLEPTSLAVTQTSLFQVSLSWQNDTHHVITGSRIERSADPTFVDGVVNFVVNSSTASFSDATVILGTTYYYRAFAFNKVGESAASNTAAIFVSTDIPIGSIVGAQSATVPTVLTGPAVSSAPNSFTLTGSISNLGSAEKALAYFEWGIGTSYGNASDQIVLTAAGSFSATLKNLAPSQTYHFRAVAVGDGIGTHLGQDATFSTPAASSTGGSNPVKPPVVVAPAPKTTVIISPDKDAEIKSPSGNITLTIPKGAVSGVTDIEFTELAPPGSSGTQFVNLFELTATDQASKSKITTFAKNLQITINHPTGALAGLDTTSLHLYYLNETTKQWLPANSSTFDPKTGSLTATTNHFTLYGEQANPLVNGPGRVMASDVNLHSGTSTFSYPFELPPGPGGFKPTLQLTYNSGAADEMKNKRDMGSWVGIGWTMNLGRISQDQNDNRYYLELNGASYELVSSDGTNFYTMPDQHFKITRSGNTWNLYDTSGNYYRFGGTSDSQQYLGGTSGTYYRWDLSLMQDTNSNQASVTYARDIRGTSPNDWVRAAYPATLSYGSVQIIFNIGYDENDATDGYLRYDNPKTDANGLNPAPKVMETRRLNSIEIKIGASLIRKYTFDYTTSNRVTSSDYGGIYYSGSMTLWKITQVGADGTSTLPFMAFTYQTKLTYLHDSSAVDYVGNPGNAATFNWLHLTGIDSGYGGTVTFAYAENPTSPVADIWTREVVTSRTINPGIGSTEVSLYTYTGNPQYFMNDGNDWEAKYRGFSQVKVTDSASNYIKHYFNTIDANDGDAEKLTGMETKTEWYSSGDTLLRTAQYTWDWDNTVQAYVFTRKWGGSAPIGKLAYPIGIAVNSDGFIYVADTCNNRIQKFTTSGTFITQWGQFGTGNGQFIRPISIAVGSDGSVFVTDSGNNRVQKFTASGTFVSSLGSSGSADGQFNCPLGITLASDGSIYVVDAGNNRIEKFSSSGVFVTKWGTYGTGNGQFNYPNDVSIGSDGNIYVSDRYNNRIQKFNTSGGFITTWGATGNGDGQFNNPIGLCGGSDGYIYVVDSNNNRIQKFSNIGVFYGKWGSSGSGDGQFSCPGGIVRGTDGSVYVSDCFNQRIQKFNSSGTFQTKWGDSTISADGFLQSPRGVAASSDGYIYIVDLSNGRIQKFTKSGAFVTKWGTMSLAFGITVSADGAYIYVVGWNSVQKFSNNGSLITSWGTEGSGNGQFSNPSAIAAGPDGSVYVADTLNNRIQKFDSSGNYVTQWGSYGTGNGQFEYPKGVAVASDGSVYVADSGMSRVQKFTGSGSFIATWGASGSGNGQFNQPVSISVDSSGNFYVVDQGNYRVQKFNGSGTFISKWGTQGSGNGQFMGAWGITVDSDGYVYVTDDVTNYVQKFQQIYDKKLTQVDDTQAGSKTSRTRYVYDSYGNAVTQYNDGDISTNTDDSTVWRAYYPNTTANILNKPARERIYATAQTTDSGGANLKGETLYYYDNNSSYTTPPAKGNLTKVEQKKDAPNSINAVHTYDSYGNRLTEQDPNGHTTTWTYDATYHTYPATKTYPAVTGGTFTESYTYNPGTNNLSTVTDINGQVTTYGYDTFKRLTSIDNPLGRNPDVTYEYLDWHTLGQQRILAKTYYDTNNFTWQSQFFDGLGRVLQVQSNGESGRIIINSTAQFNSQGLTDKNYVSQDYDSNQVSGYKTPEGSWKYASYLYDGLGRVTTQTSSDSTWVTNDYSTAWKDVVTDEKGRITENFFDAFNRLIEVRNQFLPTAVTAAASSVTSSSATLNGNLAGLGGATNATVSFEWGLTASYGNTTNGQARSSPGNFSASISGLSQNTTYHFRAKVVGNDTTYGNDFTLTTPTVAPSVSSIAATGISTTSAMLNGSLTSLGSSSSVTVSFEWGLTTSYGSTTNNQGLSNPSNLYAAISGLTANTTYHYRAKAVGSSTVYGSDRQFTTQSTGGNPVEINKTVGTGADDGFSGGGDFYNGLTWYEVGKPDATTSYNAWYRFTGITIPQGAVIEAAYVTLVQSGWTSGTSLKISADDTSIPTAPSSQSNHESKTRTTAGVAWTSGYSDWGWHNTPDITSVIQELVNSYSYSGGSIQILVDNNGSTTGSEATASTIEDTYAPRLYIRYHINGGTNSPPAIGTDAASNLTASSATLNGNLAGLGSASSVQVSFEWSLDLSYANATSPQDKTSTGTFTASLTGLNANTIYHVRAKAVGATTEYGSDMIIRTSQAVGQAATTTYAYDVLGNLIHVTDANGNNIAITYNWLSRKLTMTDPDMGYWQYMYDNNGNLTSQTDAKSQTITMTFDALNRLTGKSGTGLSVTYTYDSTSGGNYGKSLRTAMADAVSDSSHPSTFKYDARGRLIEEIRWEYSSGAWHSYTTSYTFDGLNRVATIVYPTGETVTNSYNGRGLPYGLSGSATGNNNLVGSTLYNQLGQITQINFNNGLRTTYGYYQLGGNYDTTGGLYGKLWEIKTLPQAGGTALQDVKYTWDDAANMATRQDVLTSQTETFAYDSLDRLTGVSGAYSNTYAYDSIGNITSMNGVAYTYGTKPHAVTGVGGTSYAYDSNGNMTTRGDQTITWNVENQPVSISGASQQSLSFNGTNSYATVTSSAALKVGESSGTSATYELWVKTTATGTTIFTDKGTVVPYIHDNGYLTVDFYYHTAASWWGATNTRINDGNWHYIAATTDGTTSKIYIDGVLKASHTANDYLTNPGNQALYIGKSSGGGYYVSGQIDEIRISSSARTQTEITNAWNSGNGSPFSVDGSTAALYHCDDQASSLTDATPNHFNGTLYNIAYTTGFPFSGGGASPATFTYDGDGKRISKTENSQTILYVNQYYEKNLTTGIASTYYFLGGKLIAEREATSPNATLRFFHQDSLNSTSLVTSSSGTSLGSMTTYPFGAARSGSVPTDEKFTGQRLDSTTGLYYYNARYYDPAIGRFISADTIVQNPSNPQTLNRYSYTLNNPLRYIDPSGHKVLWDVDEGYALSPAQPAPDPVAPDVSANLPIDSAPVDVAEPQPSAPPGIDQGLIKANETVPVGTSPQPSPDNPTGMTFSEATKLADQYGGKPSEYLNGTRTAPTNDNIEWGKIVAGGLLFYAGETMAVGAIGVLGALYVANPVVGAAATPAVEAFEIFVALPVMGLGVAFIGDGVGWWDFTGWLDSLWD